MMTFFPDLTTHTYMFGREERDVLNIGWLGEGNPMPIGETSREFHDRLAALCENCIGKHRGAHCCEYCTADSVPTSLYYGNGQIRVRDRSGTWYAAPTLIHHYVVDHSYLPPPAFIDAVMDPLEVATTLDELFG